MRMRLDNTASYRTMDAKRRVVLNYPNGRNPHDLEVANDVWYLIGRAHTLAATLGAIFS